MDTHGALCVLVVDDCQDQVDSLALLLNFWGHRTIVACDGSTAVNLALEHRPDIVLLDLGLPGRMDGYEVARRLRACPPTAKAVLVALTGYGQEADRQRAGEAGFDHFLLKPSEPKQLKSLLDRHAGLEPVDALPVPPRESKLEVLSLPLGPDDGLA